jgi:DNA-binding CsgD family transcriptional regulator
VSRKRGGARRIAGTQLAELAGRLTPEDRALCRLLAEHQVLAAAQIADLLYGSAHTARHRLLALHRLRVVDRFRPLVALGEGSAPYHYVLGEAGAQVLAAELGVEVHQLGYRRDRAVAVAHSPTLPQLLAASGFFAALAAAARRQPDAAVLAWWSAGRCAQQWGELVRPDAYGRWREAGSEVDFFLEICHPDLEEPPGGAFDAGNTGPGRGGDSWVERLAQKLTGYAALAAGTRIPTPVLVWCPSAGLEDQARAALPVLPVPVATAQQTPDGPAGPLWLPLGRAVPRRRLAALAAR